MFSRKNYRAAFPKDKNENISRWQLSDRNFKDDNTEYRTSEQRNKNEKKVICVSYKNQLNYQYNALTSIQMNGNYNALLVENRRKRINGLKCSNSIVLFPAIDHISIGNLTSRQVRVQT